MLKLYRGFHILAISMMAILLPVCFFLDMYLETITLGLLIILNYCSLVYVIPLIEEIDARNQD